MKITLIIIATFLISAVIFIPIGVFIRKKIAESKIQSAEKEAKRLIENVKIEAENLKKEELISAKEEVLQKIDPEGLRHDFNRVKASRLIAEEAIFKRKKED